MVENNEYAAKNYEQNECYFLSVDNDETKGWKKLKRKLKAFF